MRQKQDWLEWLPFVAVGLSVGAFAILAVMLLYGCGARHELGPDEHMNALTESLEQEFERQAVEACLGEPSQDPSVGLDDLKTCTDDGKQRLEAVQADWQPLWNAHRAFTHALTSLPEH